MSDAIIGSIGVAVVPNAEHFWERFKAQTQAGAENAAPTVKVKADTTEAEAKIAALAGEAKAVSPEVKVKADTQQATQSINALATAIITLGPATVPLAGGIAGIASSLVGLAPTALLAFGGIQANMKAGTALGQQYTAQIGVLKQTLNSLENTAAQGVLTGFQQGVAKINAEVPQLNEFVGKLSTLLGDIGSHLIGAVIAGFNTFEPLITKAAQAIDTLAGNFEKWASGPAGAKFMQTLSKDMDLVLPVLGDLLVLTGHLVAALAPIGTTVLQGIDAFAKAINAIPIPVLEAALVAFVGFKVGATIAVGINAAAAALKGFAVASEAVAISSGSTATLAALSGAGAARVAGARGAAASAAARGGEAAGAGAVALSDIAIPVAVVATLNQAAKATNDWRDSTDLLKHSVGQVLAVFDSNPLKLFGEDNQHTATRRDALALQRAATQFNTSDSAVSSLSAKSQFVSAGANAYASSLDAANAKTDALVLKQLQASGALQNTDAAFKSYTDGLQKNIAAEQSWTNLQGNKIKTIDGNVYSQKAWDAALVQSNGNFGKAEAALVGHTLALYDDQAALKQAASQQANLKQYLSDAQTELVSNTTTQLSSTKAVGTANLLTAQQVDTYTTALGLSYTAIANNSAAEKEAVAILSQVADKLQNGNLAIQGWLTAVDKFNSGTDTLTSRADLLAAGLTALQGVTLSQAGVNLSAVDSTEKLAQAIDQNKSSISSTGTLLGQLTKTTHGYVVEQPKLTAGSLSIQSAMASTGTAAINLAKTIYQNTGNANDAYKAFEGLRSQFVSTETQSLHSATAANKLADQIFGIPKDASTFVKLLGKDDVAGAIRDLTTKLGDFSKLISTAILKVNNSQANDAITTTLTGLLNLNGLVVRPTIAPNTSPVSYPGVPLTVPPFVGPVVKHKALGGFITDGTTGTADDVLIRASKGEAVIPADQAARHRDLVEALINKTAGFASGGYVAPSLLVPTAAQKKAAAKTTKTTDTSVTITADGGLAYGIADLIKGNIPQARRATADLSQAVNDAFQLKGVNTKLLAVQAQLKQLTTDAVNLRAGVEGTLSGSVDVSKYGDVGGLLDALGNQTGANSKFTGELNKLSKEGVDKSLLQRLAAAGPSAGLDTLAGATGAQIKQVNAAFGSYITSANAGGNAAYSDVFGSRITADQRLVVSLTAQQKAIGNNIDKLVSVIAKMTGRPVEIKLDGKVIASAVFKTKEFQGVLDGLTHALVYR